MPVVDAVTAVMIWCWTIDIADARKVLLIMN